MDIPIVTIEVTEDIAAKIRFIAESGLFSIHTGNATLNFHEGVLKSIKTEILSYPQKPITNAPVGVHVKITA